MTRSSHDDEHTEAQVRYQVDGDQPRLILAGVMDTGCEAAFETAFAAVAAAPPADLTIDLSQVTFLGMAGLGFFVRLRNHLAPTGHKLILLKAPNDVALTVHAAGLSKVLTLTETAAAAEKPPAHRRHVP
jgi:anti-anti-sigma factor